MHALRVLAAIAATAGVSGFREPPTKWKVRNPKGFRTFVVDALGSNFHHPDLQPLRMFPLCSFVMMASHLQQLRQHPVSRSSLASVSECNTIVLMSDPFDLDLLDDEDPFEIDDQAAHLFKHPRLGIDDVYEVWQSDPLFYPAKPPAHWLMVAEVAGIVLVVPLAPSDSEVSTKCRPIGCYAAAVHLVDRYKEDR